MSMDFYKKLKASKSSNENLADTPSEVERKVGDMQPIIHDQDVSKVQKTIAETRAPSDGIPRSPKIFRRRLGEPPPVPPVPQNKVALVEVEEKLKLMRQKRLDRLSVFVAEQSKLSEERSHKSPNESSEMEKAIKSIQKTEVEKKIIFKSIVEETTQSKVVKEDVEKNVTKSPKLGRTRSNESTDKFKNGKSSTMKFINKLNCTLPAGSSTEDLTKDAYDVSPYTKSEDVHSNQTADEENRSNLDDSEDNPLLSPVGKQRKAVYLYDHECTFLEKEKRTSLPPLTTFGKEVPQDNENQPKTKIHFYEDTHIVVKNDSGTLPVVGKAKGESKTHSYENREIIERSLLKPPTVVKSNELHSDLESKAKDVGVGRGSTGSIGESREKKNREPVVADEVKRHSAPDDQKKTEEGKRPKLTINKISWRKLNKNSHEAPRSPLPIPRRNNHAERVLKKMQRNWDSLNEILAHDSDVDCDEIEDLKKTYEEANALLTEYKTKVKKLDKKLNEELHDRLGDIKSQIGPMEESIKAFKGLKRDSSYKQMSSRLSNYFLEVNKMNCANDTLSEKRIVLRDIDRCIKMLESKVAKNEALLLEILDDQVRSIGTNCLCITKV